MLAPFVTLAFLAHPVALQRWSSQKCSGTAVAKILAALKGALGTGECAARLCDPCVRLTPRLRTAAGPARPSQLSDLQRAAA